MDSPPFLQIDDQTLSLEQSFRLLKSAGGFGRMLSDILRQHLLETELEHRPDLDATDFQIDQALMEFRAQQGLTEPEQFQNWLGQTRTSYAAFRKTVVFGIRVQKLRRDVTLEPLDAHFAEQHADYDQLLLSRIVLDDPVQAEQLMSSLQADPSQFAAAAQQHSLSPDKAVSGLMGTVRRNALPKNVQIATLTAQIGDILGVFPVEGKYCILHFQNILPAQLEGQLKTELQNRLFEQWLQAKSQKLQVQVVEPE